MNIDGHDYLIGIARCCRDWSVALNVRLGRCGHCGKVPEVVPEDEDGKA